MQCRKINELAYMKPDKIAVSQLTSLLSYDPMSGIILRKSTGTEVGAINARGYRVIDLLGAKYKASHIAWALTHGSWPNSDTIDHVNRNRSDDRICNLRLATYEQNCRNKSLNKDNKTGLSGVRWRKCSRRYVAEVSVNNRKIHLGSFSDIFEAACARKKAEIELGFWPSHGLTGAV